MYFDDNIIVIFLVVFLLALPVLWLGLSKSLFKGFRLTNLTIAFNRALIIQVVIGLVIMLISAALDKIFYSDGQGNPFSEVFIQTTYMYIIIGCFYYIPGLGVLNLINIIARKFNRVN